MIKSQWESSPDDTVRITKDPTKRINKHLRANLKRENNTRGIKKPNFPSYVWKEWLFHN